MYVYNVIYDLGSITDWLTALGTIGAVIVALYLSRRETKPRAKVTASFSHAVGPFGVSEDPIAISAEIVNLGLIPIHLKECTIALGKKKMIFPDGSQNVDKLINPGELYQHQLNYEFIKTFLESEGINKLKTYLYFKDARGKKYKSKIILRN